MYAGPFIDLIAILALKASVSLEVCSQAVRRKLFTVASKSDKIAIFAFFTTSKCCLKAIRVSELAVSIWVHDKVLLALQANVGFGVGSQAVRRKLSTIARKSDKIAIFAFFTTSKCCLKAIRVAKLAVSIRVHDKVLLALQASFVCGFRAIGVSAFTVIELKIEFTTEAVSCYNVAG